MNEQLKQFILDMNQDPDATAIRKNDDGSLYLPISHIQTLLDNVFLGQWSFEVTNTLFGRK